MSSIQTLPKHDAPAIQTQIDTKKADRLRRSLEALLRSHRGLKVIGPNETVQNLAVQCGLAFSGYCQFEIDVQGRRICLVCVPQAHWTSPSSMDRFNEVRIAAAALGHKVLLAPEALVRDAHRTHAVTTDCSSYKISGTDRSAVISFLLENGSGTLAQLAGMLRHPDPVGAVLYLAVIGAIDVDLDSAIAPATQVRFPLQVH